MNGDHLDVLVVAGGPCWPAVNGGRARTGALALALAREFEVAVAAPPDPTEVYLNKSPLWRIELPAREPPSLRHRIGIRPSLGRAVLGRAALAVLAKVIDRTQPRFVLYAMSYLAAVGPEQHTAAVVVDFANIEAERLASLAGVGPLRRRASAAAESVKAQVWEPKVARIADLAVAVSDADAAHLMEWGADVVVVPNVADPVQDAMPSDPGGTVVFVASFGYAPNAEAARDVLRHVWPRVLARVPDAKLVLAGHESERYFGWAREVRGVSVAGEVASVDTILADAAIVLGPVTRGGGTQLKVVQALAARRVVVATPYSARSAPRELASCCVVADDWSGYADAVVNLLTDVERRHTLEAALRRAEVRGWNDAVAPLIERLRSIASYRTSGLSQVGRAVAAGL